MKKSLVVVMLSAGTVLMSQAPSPTEWIDAATGHRVVRLTGEAGGSTLYFHDNAFSPDGRHDDVQHPGRHCGCGYREDARHQDVGRRHEGSPLFIGAPSPHILLRRPNR